MSIPTRTLEPSATSSTISPCVGRCSTVFGDSVCRGCRRFSHEVIDWNRYTTAQRQFIWQRLDQQLNQIALTLIAVSDFRRLGDFLQHRQLRLPETASDGRLIHETLRHVQRQPDLLPRSGLGIRADQLDSVWHEVERQLYALAVASYELAWLRAACFGGMSVRSQ